MAKQSQPLDNSLSLGIWLLICATAVFVMVVVGGVTRLTQSGLSMVEWAPIMGTLPPFTEADWLAVFAKYQQFPEYQKINQGMSLSEFKGIFWWEYGHRVLGRLIGLIYLVPLLYFLIRKMVPSHWYLRLFGLFVLGGLQGLMGWYMVKSGLVDVPHVSQYRLAAHFSLAIVIFMFMFWYSMSFLRGQISHAMADSSFRRLSIAAVGCVLVMMVSGAFVAGTKAGFIMNTFPLSNGQWIPEGLWAMQPAWKNLFENAVTVQYTHRIIALIVVLVLMATVLKARKQRYSTGAWLMLAALVLQLTLGISALLMKVPVGLGAAHQAGAVLLLASCLYVAHRARFSQQPSS